ncbi:hypothetical protein LTSEALA_5131 [Salmonella enterica subsp. enterica serovar Alachua str. R6-377]|uniref:Uncharacterized protein n=1 Tax=Salmonella enterica subsp. enterica serovar Alachua str. R6-377 TaxID=913241 RepID=G5LV46_SALET|nr:hypothetical protein LTSEALA_5131 [Salmonella enterica subsp. enterica serovar Alachua str. R6-377]
MAEPALLRTFGERTGINLETNFNTIAGALRRSQHLPL